MKNLMIVLFVAMGYISSAQSGCSCLPNGIEFTTQAQIDSFPVNHPGCYHIGGDVSIVGPDITNLDGLSNLYSIGGRLSIGWACIQQNMSLTSLVGLENLVLIGGDFNIMLTPLNNLEGLNSLSEVGGKFLIGGTNITTFAGVEELQSVGDLEIGYSCADFGFYWEIGNERLKNLDGLQNLTNIGYLSICHNDSLYTISSLGNANLQGKGIHIEDNDALNDLSALENITSLKYLDISGNYALADLTGFNSLVWLEGSLAVKGNHNLANLKGLSNLGYIGGDVVVEGNDALINLEGLEGISQVNGKFIIKNTSLITLHGLENLNTVNSDFSIEHNLDLINLQALQNLTETGGSLKIIINSGLIDLDGLESLTSVGGGLLIAQNANLTSLAGLDGLDTVTGNVTIGPESPSTYLGNGQLTDISALAQLDYIGGELVIRRNESLSDCAIESICNYLQYGDTARISNNASGCNSPQEVEVACEFVSMDEFSERNNISIYPNPSNSFINIELLSNPTKTAILNISNLQGHQLLSQVLNTAVTTIDVANYPPGLYFIQIWQVDSVFISRFVKE